MESDDIFFPNGVPKPRDYRTAQKHFLKYYKCKEHGLIESADILWIQIDGEEVPCCSICKSPVMKRGDK